MKANIKNNANSFTNTTYPTAIFLIEGNTLYAALDSNEKVVPFMPVSKSSNGKCNFVCVMREQKFVDAVLNDMFYDRENPTTKFSVRLRSQETIVISDGQMVVAVASSISALHFAVQNIYDNIDQFQTLW